MGLKRPDDAGACSRRNLPDALAPGARAAHRLAPGLDRRTTREGRARAHTRGDWVAGSSDFLGFLRLRERVAQLGSRAVEAGLDGGDGEVEGLADLLEREVGVVVEKDGQAVRGVELR